MGESHDSMFRVAGYGFRIGKAAPIKDSEGHFSIGLQITEFKSLPRRNVSIRRKCFGQKKISLKQVD